MKTLIPESCHAQRRRRRNAQLGGTRDERVANGVAGAKPAQIARAAEHRFVEGRRRPAEIFAHGSKRQYGSAVNADVAVRVDLGPDRRVAPRKMQPLDRGAHKDRVVRHQRIHSRIDDHICADRFRVDLLAGERRRLPRDLGAGMNVAKNRPFGASPHARAIGVLIEERMRASLKERASPQARHETAAKIPADTRLRCACRRPSSPARQPGGVVTRR